jgi:hypothetical protein
MEKLNIYSILIRLCACLPFIAVFILAGCATTGEAGVNKNEPVKVHYLDDGSTIKVDDPLFDGEDVSGLTLLEKIKKISEELNVECEKNALLSQELAAMRQGRDDLQQQLEEEKYNTIKLNEQIAALKLSLSERETAVDQSMREKRDLMEKLINLKIEKAKVEKELLKIKIAALSGEG